MAKTRVAPPATPPAAEALVAVIVTAPVRHDGQDVPVGTALALAPEAAAALVAAGAAAPAEAE
jgi:hypothetical protein